MHFQGRLFRVLDVVWQHAPLSGEGAKLSGGRFNPKGQACLYTSLHYEIALRETTQGIGDIEPSSVVAYHADIENLLDLSSTYKISNADIDIGIMRSPNWRDEMDNFGISRSQEFAQSILDAGHPGMLVPSFAPGALAGDVNVVLWKWGPDLPHQVLLHDPHDRLGRVRAGTPSPP